MLRGLRLRRFGWISVGGHGNPGIWARQNATNPDSDARPPKLDGKTKGKKSDNGSRIDTAFAEGSRGRRGADRALDVLMLNAKRQAEEYSCYYPT
jgi:hypothetical protein